MNNPESSFPHAEFESLVVPGVQPEKIEEIKDDPTIAAQPKVMRFMIPMEIKPFVTESDGEQLGGLEDELFVRWFSKYANLFREFYEGLDRSDEEEAELASHIESETVFDGDVLTEKDKEKIRQYLEDPKCMNKGKGIGGRFFETEEIGEFLRENTH